MTKAVNSLRVSTWNELKLWPHQIEAITHARKYQKAYANFKGAPPSALICMPTGTGKSGVIAVLSKCFQDTSTILVLCPWAALREQLARDIEFRFWERLGQNSDAWAKPVCRFFPTTVDKCLKEIDSHPSVLLCTIQTLQSIFRRAPSTYQKLRDRISLVIVDEGHREPAPEWGAAVRGLEKPAILFTATPYRNDHKIFNIDLKHVYRFRHQLAEEERFIRKVDFREGNLGQTREQFVKSLLEYYRGEFKKQVPKGIEPRVIVRCDTNDEINEISHLLQRSGETVIGIHERFEEQESEFLTQSIPNPQTTSATFWVHQNKLIEGIDDPRFCLLAIFGPFRSARSLVQQVGRILRNPDRKRNQTAVVLARRAHHQKSFWDLYRKYDLVPDEQLAETDLERERQRILFDTTVNLQDELQYFEGNYRERFSFDPEIAELHSHLRYPRSANVFLVSNAVDVDFEELSQKVIDEWWKQDKDVRYRHLPDANTFVHVYQSYHNSPWLLHHALTEFSIGFTVCHRKGRYLFFYDSEGLASEYLTKRVRRVAPVALERLFRGSDARISQISLLNTDLGQHSIRRRSIHAFSIQQTAPDLNDHAYFFSTARGYTKRGKKEFVRRYVGFARARVSDTSSIKSKFRDYITWLDSIASALDQSETISLPLFGRYARHTDPPSDPSPVNILLDLDQVADNFESVPGKGLEREILSLNEICYDVRQGKANILANSREFEATIAFDKKRVEYVLDSRELERAFVRRNPLTDEKQENLVSYINRTQSFRVIPTTPRVIYAHGHFYQPRLPLWGSRDDDHLDLLTIFRPTPGLDGTGSEKGTAVQKDGLGWEKGCLFHLIDHLGEPDSLAGAEKDVDILICDDLGNEVADFVAASSNQRRVIFIHAKAHATPKRKSASSFQEVCGQAVKNLSALHPFVEKMPNGSKWDRAWNGPNGKVKNRIRRAPQGKRGAALATLLESLIRNPATSREVWIVLGQGFSLQDFETERHKQNPRPEIVQIFYLLQSTWSAVKSVGATLQIFCSP